MAASIHIGTGRAGGIIIVWVGVGSGGSGVGVTAGGTGEVVSWVALTTAGAGGIAKRCDGCSGHGETSESLKLSPDLFRSS